MSQMSHKRISKLIKQTQSMIKIEPVVLNQSNNQDLAEHVNKCKDFDAFEITTKELLDTCETTVGHVNLSNIQIGDMVEISYLPYSQKYIDHYENEKIRGRVFFVSNDDALVYCDTREGRIVKSLYVDGCSYGFHDSLGYDLCINKLKLSKKRKLTNNFDDIIL